MGRYIKSLKLPHKRGGCVRAVKRWGDIDSHLFPFAFLCCYFYYTY